jgi:hypothetical protein
MKITMRKASLIKSGLAASVLLFASSVALAQSVSLTAKPTTTTLPDGQTVPMWGLFCNNAGTGASCTTLKAPSTVAPALWAASTAYAVGASVFDGTNVQVAATAGTSDVAAPAAWNATVGGTTTDSGVTWTNFGTLAQYQAGSSATWAPPVITVPAGSSLSITLVNNLSFPVGSLTPTTSVPTSLVIVGQLGGGLGTSTAKFPVDSFGRDSSGKLPPQGTTWPGTLGTTNPGDPAFQGPAQAARVRSFGTEVAAAGATLVSPQVASGSPLTWGNLRPGTYLIESGTEPSIQGPMGLYGVLVVTESDVSGAHMAYGTAFDTAVPLLLSEIDPVQNTEVAQVVQNAGFSDTTVWNGQVGKCGDVTAPATAHTCYPPAVNYTPLYYLINGVSFDATNGLASALTAPAAGTQTRVLLRFVNAGLRMHVPSVVGAPMTLVAEDSNKLPGLPRIQNEVFLAAGKTYDVTIQPKQTTAGTYDAATLAVFDRALGVSTNNQLDGGMQAYIKVAGGAASGVGSTASNSTATANPDSYPIVLGNPLSISDVAKGVIANDVAVYGVTVMTPPTAGTLNLNPNGTFSYAGFGSLGISLTSGGSTYLTAPVPTITGGGGSGATAVATINSAGVVDTVTIVTPGSGYTSAPSVLFPTPAGGTAATATVSFTPTTTSDSFVYEANGQPAIHATVSLTACTGVCLGARPVAGSANLTSNIATRLQVTSPGLLAYVTNSSGLPLTATPSTVATTCGSVTVNPDGSFTATPGATPASCQFNYNVLTSTKLTSASDGVITVNFLKASNLAVNVKDAKNGVAVVDYRWIIEEDKTFWIDPKCQVNSLTLPLGCPAGTNGPWSTPATPVESLGYNFHTAHMDVVAQGCVGDISCESGQTINGGTPTACDIGNGICPTGGTKSRKDDLFPSSVHLDPSKRYFISILPGDGVNATIGGAGGPDGNTPFDIATACGPYNPSDPRWQPGNLGTISNPTTALCGHAMGGAQIPKELLASAAPMVDIKLQQTPLPTARIAVFVFQDDNPLNGENDAGGGVDIIAPNEPGLGGFEVKLFDQAGGLGDATGQITYDMFNQPVSNSLAGKIDPITKLDSCPINSRIDTSIGPSGDRMVGMIPTCPKFESDNKTPSPLAGQAVIANLYPGLYEVVATPAADRIARGEEWVQTNTLDGGKPHEAFIKPNEPGYFQEFGPGGFHVSIGFANPALITAKKTAYCGSTLNAGAACDNTLTVNVSNNHMSRTPDQRTFSSETYDHYGFTQCYVAIGPADGEDFAFQKCSADGQVTFTGMPGGVFKITVFDQWNDIMLDGLVGTLTIAPGGGTTTKEFPVTQWRTNLTTRTFIDTNGDGVSGTYDHSGVRCTGTDATTSLPTPSGCNTNWGSNDTAGEPGLALVNTNIHYRDGSIGFFNNTDLDGYAGFNEVFPFMNWLVVETSSTRFKPTGVHTVYDAGGPVDCSQQANLLSMPCTGTAANIANTAVRVPLPGDLRVPGAKYCDNADCLTTDAGGGASTGTVFPPQAWGTTQGWQGLLGQNSFMEFGVKPFAAGENGGISGMVIYASTRPFDDPALSLQLSWEPGVPRAKVNLYQKTVDGSGNEHLTLVDTTTTTSWDDWAQGFRKDASGTLMQSQSATGAGYIPNMNCPGQTNDSPFFATLKNSKQWLDTPGAKKALAYQSQFKCYDGWSQLNQVQPAPYDGLYKFPSVVTVGADGKPATTNCTGCVLNTKASAGDWNYNKPMLPPGKYVVEVVMPPGYELVKEEDKNILLGDVYIAPVTQQFAGFGNIFIMPDQAAVSSAYNPNNPGSLNLTNNLGASPRHEGDTGSVESFWPCVGAARIVPDLNSLYPGAGQAAPFAGAKRRLCDRKEVTLKDQAAALTKFYVFTSTHIAGHFTGTITNDFASEFDPFSPQFGEKFGPPNLPVGMRDFTGNEVARVYSDQWGIYNGLYFSSYSVNPPNPTGYVPQMSIACMNDPGPILDTRTTIQNPDGTGTISNPTLGQMITDPAYNPAYSNFCYETPFMPGFTAYMDTPVIPTQAFADQYNLPDTEYPDRTPAIKTVMNSLNAGPWVDVTTTDVPASVSFSIGGVDRQTNTATIPGDQVTSVSIGTTTLTSAVLRCGAIVSGSTSVDCTNNGGNARNSNMAAALRTNINANTGTSGYTASGSNTNVIITAAAGTGATPNGLPLTFNQTGLTPVTDLSLSGGVTAHTGTTTTALTITALGDKVVQNPNYAGPNASAAPYNQKTITRHYGFGATRGTVTITGPNGSPVALSNVSWSDTTITASVPNGVCPPPRQAAGCKGELVIAGANGKQSIDAITVTVGGRAPWVVTANDVATNTGGTVTPPSGKSVKDYTAAFGRMFFSPIQTAIDSADPGDLIIVKPGTYRENLLMWKPVRLQGVGAASVTINADAHPAGKMDSWRRQVNCTFGLDVDGVPNLGNAHFPGMEPSNSGYSCPNEMHQRVDRIPFEAIVGWDASGNGNLAQVLQEPTLMGAYEGAGITVLGRGVRIPSTSNDFWGLNATGGAGAFADGSVYLTGSNADCATSTDANGRDYGTSNFYCNPSSIDGMSVINSSQGGGGVFLHGWNHSIDVANTRISGNHGTLAGAINLGNGETPDAFINNAVECGPGQPVPSLVVCPPTNWTGPRSIYRPGSNEAIAFQFNTNVRIHNNMLYNNASIGDALFSGTPSGAGAITVSAGGDGYRIDHNWIAGNLSTGDGGGVQHLGLSFQGTIDHNYILFNQSSNPTLPTNGGGLTILGANLDRTLNGFECGSLTDQDCPPGLGQGTGKDLQIDANLILGNSAESGSGGGMRLQQINGSDLASFPGTPNNWYDVTVSNNIIANNVAGWDGGGVSMQDALKVTLVNNSVVSNDTTASAGVLFKTLGAIYSATPPPGCTPTTDPTLPQNPNCTIPDAPHMAQPAGLVTMAHTPNLLDALATSITCPTSIGDGSWPYDTATNGNCRVLSIPKIINDMYWQNRAFSVDISTAGTGLQSQQNLVALSPELNQAATGACPSGANYWDVGVRGDLSVTGGATKLSVTNSILTNAANATGTNNVVPGGSPIIGQFCTGARTPPESCSQLAGGLGQSCHGFNAPPGSSETTGLAQVFVFNGIKPTATVDEGHNWLNLTFGPLTLNRATLLTPTDAPEQMVAVAAFGTTLGAYSIPNTSAARNAGLGAVAPRLDFFGRARYPAGTPSATVDIGAVAYAASTIASASVTGGPLTYTATRVGVTSAAQTLTLSNTGAGTLSGIVVTVTAPFSRAGGAGNCGGNLAAGSVCTIYVTFTPTAAGPATGSVTVTGNVLVAGSPVSLSGTGVANAPAASVSPSPLDFGVWAKGTTSNSRTLTVTNTGNVALTGFNLTFTAPFARTTGGGGGAGGTCANNLAVGASCTINVRFAPVTATPTGAVSGSVTVAYTTAGTTVTPTPVVLTGTAAVARAAMSVTPNPLTITLATGANAGTGTVTLSNLSPAGSAQVLVTGVDIASSSTGYIFAGVTGQDTCTGTVLAPLANCTVGVSFTNGSAARGSNRAGTITFTDNGVPGNPPAGGQRGNLTGLATP